MKKKNKPTYRTHPIDIRPAPLQVHSPQEIPHVRKTNPQQISFPLRVIDNVLTGFAALIIAGILLSVLGATAYIIVTGATRAVLFKVLVVNLAVLAAMGVLVFLYFVGAVVNRTR